MYKIEQFRSGTDYDWARLLRAYRAATRCKQTTLAEDLGVAQPQVSRWENGYSRPSRRHQAQILDMASQVECVAPSPSWMDRITRTAAFAMCVGRNSRIRTISEGFLEAAGLTEDAVLNRPLAEVFEGDLVILFDELRQRRFFDGTIDEIVSAERLQLRPELGGKTFLIRANHWMRLDPSGAPYWTWVGAVISEDWFARTRDSIGHWSILQESSKLEA
jgi:transcriptional regulator with XRE-family HTH domain